MAYLKIDGTDFSQYVNKLLVQTKHKYTARENASGTLMVKYITDKKTVQVGIIPLDAASLKSLMTVINKFEVTVSYLNPETDTLETINCIIPTNSVEYYTIQAGNTSAKAFNFSCEEL